MSRLSCFGSLSPQGDKISVLALSLTAMKSKSRVIILTDSESSLRGFVRVFSHKDNVIGVSSPKELHLLLSPERLRLLRVAREHKPDSIEELARLLDRDTDDVKKDVLLLDAVGLLDLYNGRPVVEYEEIVIKV